MKPVRVFWYCEKWQPGGIQKVQVNLLSRFDPEQVSFDMAVCQKETELFDETLRRNGARLLVTLARRYARPAVRTLHNVFAVKRVLRDGDYGVAHFNVCHGVELIYTFWAWRYRVPVRIAHCRNNDIGAGGRSRAIKRAAHVLCRRLFGWCTNVHLANSDLAGRWLFPAGDYRVLKNGIDTRRFLLNREEREAERKRLGLEDAFVVGHVGHFSYQKNHELLLDIFGEIHRRAPEARLLLVGSGEGERAVREKAEALGLSDKVIFYGATNDVQVAMWAMDAFVFPSRFEGFGNVLIEAQAAGLPCYASKDVIPAEVALSSRLHWVSLSAPAGAWAEQVLCGRKNERADAWVCEASIQRAGYDLNTMARELQAIYMGGEKNVECFRHAGRIRKNERNS